MQTKLKNLISGLTISEQQKDYLSLLIKQEQEDLVMKILESVQGVMKGLGEKEQFPISSFQFPSERVKQQGSIIKESVQVGSTVGGQVSSGETNTVAQTQQVVDVDEEVNLLAGAFDYAEELWLKAEETYDKVNLSLKKNDKWLERLIEKVGRSKQDIKDRFIALLTEARTKLKGIDEKMDNYWSEMQKKKNDADYVLGAQVSEIRSVFESKTEAEVPEKVSEFIKRLCDQHKEKIDNMSKAFSDMLDSTAKEIDYLTNETSEKMKDIVNEREQKKLMEKIMSEGK
ncbi:MAG: hypothetical protein ACOZAR_00425 [Patescibacteria group bacterium]